MRVVPSTSMNRQADSVEVRREDHQVQQSGEPDAVSAVGTTVGPPALTKNDPLLLAKSDPPLARDRGARQGLLVLYESSPRDCAPLFGRTKAFARSCHNLESAGRVKGDTVGVLGTRTLDASEHSKTLNWKRGRWSSFREQTRVISRERLRVGQATYSAAQTPWSHSRVKHSLFSSHGSPAPAHTPTELSGTRR